MRKFTISQIKKTNLDDTFFGKYFYRNLSTYFTYFLVKTPLTPNHISVLSLLSTLVGAYFFFLGDYRSLLIGVVFVQVGMILDYSDGQVARLKKLSSRRGAWLDVILGMIQNNIFILAVIIGLYKLTSDLSIWVVGSIVLFAWNMTCYVHLNTMIFFPNLELKRTEAAAKVRKIFNIKPQYLSVGSDVYFVIIGIGAIFSAIEQSLVYLAIVGNLYWISVAVFLFRNTKNVT